MAALQAYEKEVADLINRAIMRWGPAKHNTPMVARLSETGKLGRGKSKGGKRKKKGKGDS